MCEWLRRLFTGGTGEERGVMEERFGGSITAWERPRESSRYDSLIAHYAPPSIGPLWIWAQIMAESGANPKAVSSAGARGLSQFMPKTWGEWGDGGDIENPEDAIKAQCRYMDWLHKTSGADIEKAFAAYNWGIGNVTRADDGWKDKMPGETVQYLKNIVGFYEARRMEEDLVR